MPIKDTDASNVTQTCNACGAEHVIAINTLELGIDAGGGFADKNVIVFPACATCGAVENMIRTWDECPAAFLGTVFDKQRRAVNALGQKLRADGLIHASHVAAVNAEPGPPPDVDNGGAWPPTPSAIPVPKGRGNQGGPES